MRQAVDAAFVGAGVTLDFHQSRITPVFCHQFVMRTLFSDDAVVDHQNAIAIAQRA